MSKCGKIKRRNMDYFIVLDKMFGVYNAESGKGKEYDKSSGL